MVSTYIVLFPDIVATLLILDQFIVFWLAATEQKMSRFKTRMINRRKLKRPEEKPKGDTAGLT